VLAFFLKFVPKVGPFKAIDFKIPTRKTEDLYIASVNRALDDYRNLLAATGTKELHLANTDFDTGRTTRAGEYALCDDAYEHLLDQLAQHDFHQVTPELRENILGFFDNPGTPVAIKRKAVSQQKTQDELRRLKDLAPPEHPAIQVSTLP
jgi:hypothetical protein